MARRRHRGDSGSKCCGNLCCGAVLAPQGLFPQQLRTKSPLWRRFGATRPVPAVTPYEVAAVASIWRHRDTFASRGAQFMRSHANFLVSHLVKDSARLRSSRTKDHRLRHKCALQSLEPSRLAIKTVTKGVVLVRATEVGGAFRWAVTRVQTSACLWMHEFTPEAVADPSQFKVDTVAPRIR